MAHLQEGWEYDDVAQFLCVKSEKVQKWVKRVKVFGLDGQRESLRSDAKRKLKKEQEIDFKTVVIALQENRTGGRIAGHDIQGLLK